MEHYLVIRSYDNIQDAIKKINDIYQSWLKSSSEGNIFDIEESSFKVKIGNIIIKYCIGCYADDFYVLQNIYVSKEL